MSNIPPPPPLAAHLRVPPPPPFKIGSVPPPPPFIINYGMPPPPPGFGKVPKMEDKLEESYKKLPKAPQNIKRCFVVPIQKRNIKDTIFDGMVLDLPMDDYLNKLGTLFTFEEKKKVVEKKELKELIYGSDAQTIEMLFYHFNKTFPSESENIANFILKVIEEMDIEKLKYINYIDILIDLVESNEKEEIEKRKQEIGDQKMDKLSDFYYKLININYVHLKLNAMKFILEAEEMFNYVEPRAVKYQELCDQLYTSEKIKEIIKIIHTVVNYFNTARKSTGPIYGFKVEQMMELDRVRAEKKSLLETIIEEIVQDFPHLVNWMDDIPDLLKGEIFDDLDIEPKLQHVIDTKKYVDELKRKLRKNEYDKESKENIINHLDKSFEKIIPIITKSEELLKKYEESSTRLVKYFGNAVRQLDDVKHLIWVFQSLGRKWVQYIHFMQTRDYIEQQEKRRVEKKERLAESIKKRKERNNLFRYNRIVAEDIKREFLYYQVDMSPLIIRQNEESAVKGQFTDEQKVAMKKLFEQYIDVE